MIFCQIDADLCKLILRLAKRRLIIDCGAGEGLLGSLLPGQVLSLDLFPPDFTLSPVLCMNVENYEFTSGCVPVFLRPCHSGFVHRTIMRNLQRVRLFLYVSKPINLEVDLDSVSSECTVTQVGTWIGQEGERVYTVTPKQPEATSHTFVLVSNGYSTFWVKDISDPAYYVNGVGGKFPRTPNDALKTVVLPVDDDQQLDWSGTAYDVPDSDYGWLSPDGRWFGCRYENHDLCAWYMIKKEVGEVEAEGYVRVNAGPEDNDPYPYTCEKRVTAEQRNWLHLHGYVVNEQD